MEVFKDLIFFITHPRYWVMNDVYCREWDQALKTLLDTKSFKRSNGSDVSASFFYTLDIGDSTVWIRNHPYSQFRPSYMSGYFPQTLKIRPSRRTIYRANKKMINDIGFDPNNQKSVAIREYKILSHRKG